MPEFNRLTLLGLAAVCIAAPLPAQIAQPPATADKRQFFALYRDDRSVLDKVKNSLGATKDSLGRGIALIIAMSEYPAMSGSDRSLAPADQDAANLVAYLRDQEMFDEIIVLRNRDVTLDNLQYFLQDYFPEELSRFPKSRLLVTYSGHGAIENGEGFLLTSAAKNLSDAAHGISMTVFRQLMSRLIRSDRRLLVLVNACHSGAFGVTPFGSSELAAALPGAHAILASTANQLSWADPRVGKGSIFFEAILEGLRGPADLIPPGGDGVITTSELFAYLRNRIGDLTNQHETPELVDLLQGGSPGGFLFLNRQRHVARGIVPEWKGDVRISFGSREVSATPALQAGTPSTLPAKPNGSDALPTSLTVTPATASLFVGGSVALSATISRSNDQSVTWTSSNPTVATVDTSGVVRVIAVGAAEIVAHHSSGLTASTAVTVSPRPDLFGEVTDPAGDAPPFTGLYAGLVAPDLVDATASVTSGVLTFVIRFARGTFDPATTVVELCLDTDQNPATGYPGLDQSERTQGGMDRGMIGCDYLVDAGSAGYVRAELASYDSSFKNFTSVSLFPFTALSDGYSLRIPLSALGNDDGRINFKVATKRRLSPGLFTTIGDIMPDVGLPPGRTAPPN